jgi:hypothetical protein
VNTIYLFILSIYVQQNLRNDCKYLVHVLFCLVSDFVRYFPLPEIKLSLGF